MIALHLIIFKLSFVKLYYVASFKVVVLKICILVSQTLHRNHFLQLYFALFFTSTLFNFSPFSILDQNICYLDHSKCFLYNPLVGYHTSHTPWTAGSGHVDLSFVEGMLCTGV